MQLLLYLLHDFSFTTTTTKLFLRTHFISKARQGNILLTISKILNSALRDAGYTKKVMCVVIYYPLLRPQTEHNQRLEQEEASNI